VSRDRRWRASEAYAECDEERIRRILWNWQASPDSVEGEGSAAELVRVIRKLTGRSYRAHRARPVLETSRTYQS
jgi:hypothetical protein